jgi:hypothetical protein
LRIFESGICLGFEYWNLGFLTMVMAKAWKDNERTELALR